MTMGFVDVQVNGYAGVSFHRGDPPTEPRMRLAARRLEAGGVRAVLATVTTDDLSRMALRLRTMRQLIDGDAWLRRLIPAFHIEGPCLSPVEGFRGAHQPEYIRPATREVLEPLIEAGGGPERVAMVTLAPEEDAGLRTTRWLAEQGIIVSAGHTDAPLDCLRAAEQAGLAMFTHLGNGTAALLDRHDNIIYRAMSLEHVRYALIHDGQHLPFYVARQWIRWLGVERCIFATDCVEAADAPSDFVLPPGHTLDRSGQTPVLRLTGTPYLAGAAHTMRQGHDNAVQHMGLSPAEARAMSCEQPARLIEKWMGEACGEST